MDRDQATILSVLAFFMLSTAQALTVERYDIVIYQKVESQNSTLSCLLCYNGDATNDCQTLKDISKIPIVACQRDEPFCKVRRLHEEGNLSAFDRYCAKHCEPGCREGAMYLECVSCCNHTSLCNVDNSASALPKRGQFLCTMELWFVLVLAILSL